MSPSKSTSHPTSPLANRNFRYLLAGDALNMMLGPLQFLTQILWVQHHAPEHIWLILVALIGASRGLGALTFGLYGGALADRFDRRKLLISAQCLLVVTTLGIGFLMLSELSGILGFSLFFTLALISAGLQAVDIPTRLAIIPDVLGAELTPRGITMNQLTTQIAMPMAMFATGFIIHWLDFGGAYLFSTMGNILIILCLLMIRDIAHAPEPQKEISRYGFRRGIQDVRDGFRYARGHTLVFWVIILLISMMSLGFPATANLGPTWITKYVGVPIIDLGYVVMTWGVGSLLGALFLMRLSDVTRRGRLICGGALIFCGSFFVFVMDKTVANAVIGNLGLGAGMTITSVSSTILIQQLVPNEVRGRIMSIFQLNMGFAQLMTMPVAMLGQWLTLPVLFPIMAVVTFIVVLLILLSQRQIWRA